MYPGRRLQAGRHRQTKQPAQAERDQAGEQGTQQMSLTSHWRKTNGAYVEH